MAGEQQVVEGAADQALTRLPQRRPASLYDIAVQYSILDWYVTVSSGELDFDLDPEHLAFMTPRAKDDLYGQEDNAIIVYADLSDKENPALRDERPVTIETVTEDQRFRLGHSYPANKTNNTDHSVTTHKSADAHHLSGKRDSVWGRANVQDRFSRWAQREAAQAVADRDDVANAWIIDALAQLGDNEDAMDRVQDAFLQLVDYDEDRELEAFVTIRVKLPGEDEYRWPGEIPALNEVMVEEKTERFENMSVTDAAGEGVGYVTGNEGRVTGGSAGLLGMFGKLQREHFADLSPDGSEAWRARPVSRETAAALATANSVFEEFYQGLGNSRRLYVFPYLAAHPDRISPDEFAWFADSVFGSLRQREDTFQTAVDNLFFEREQDDENDVQGLFADPDNRRYEWVGIATSFVVTGNPDRVFFERLDTDQYRPLEIEFNHSEILQTPQFDTTGVFADTVSRSESALLTPGADLAGMVLFGRYFDRTTEPTRSSREAQDTPKAGDIDDIRARRLRQLLTNEPVTYETLLEEYLHRLVQNQRNRFDEDHHGVPANETVEQYVQLRALYESGALERSSPSVRTGASTPDGAIPTIATVTTQHSSSEFASRDERLTEFIENHEVLQENNPRQAVFLLGGLIGRITAYQRANNVSSTLVRRYPIDYLTKQSIKEVTNEVLQMNNTYVESDDELPSTYNARYIDKLPNLMLSSDPSEWQFTQNELQWLYALGIAYGSNDTSIQTEE